MVFRAADEADAIRIANDTPYGLGSYVYTTTRSRPIVSPSALEVGMVFVNGVGMEAVELPFGGVDGPASAASSAAWASRSS